MTDPESTPPTRPRYTAGQIVMTVLGVILLLPGLCSLLVMLDTRRNDPMYGLFVGVWVICFLVSAIGGALICAARRRARRTQ